jgi:hypothetical protein
LRAGAGNANPDRRTDCSRRAETGGQRGAQCVCRDESGRAGGQSAAEAGGESGGQSRGESGSESGGQSGCCCVTEPAAAANSGRGA